MQVEELDATRITELTRGRLLNKHPFFGSLALKMPLVMTDKVPTAGTDGVSLLVNPEWFMGLSKDERLFVFGHEICHVIFRHIQRAKVYKAHGSIRGLPFDFKQWNAAGDYYINAFLINMGLGTMPSCGLYKNKYDNESMTVEDIYVDIYDPTQQGSGDDENCDGQGGGNGQGTEYPKNWDEHIMSDAEGMSEAEASNAIAEAKQVAERAGKLSSELREFVDKLLKPKLDWRAILLRSFKAVYGRERRSFARPNKRRAALGHVGAISKLIAPRLVSDAYGELAVIVDTSGSITQAERSRYLTELVNLADKYKVKQMRVYMCHTHVYHTATINSAADLKALPFSAGGTNMEAAYRVIADEQPKCELIVCLTDGYTTFTTPPTCPMVWLMTTEVRAPYGTNIEVEIND